MKRTETTDTITVKLLERLCMGDDSALERLYLTLRQRFLFVALNFFRDEHEAQTAFDEAFLKLQARLRDGFEWQGEPQLYRYFRTIVINECRDTSRKGKKQRDWEADYVVSLTYADDEDDTVTIEHVEIAVGCDPYAEEVEMQRNANIQGEIKKYLAELTPQERRFWEAYQALVETPGSDQWGDHEKTAFLRSYLNLSESAFYPAHSRFKKKLKPLARCLGLLR
jgi:RNA polymerase sigma factor (sigma-70 family)